MVVYMSSQSSQMAAPSSSTSTTLPSPISTAESTEIKLATGAKCKKLGGYDFYREVLGSPKFIVAPMVDQSELVRIFPLVVFPEATYTDVDFHPQPWRRLSRRYGAQVSYRFVPELNCE